MSILLQTAIQISNSAIKVNPASNCHSNFELSTLMKRLVLPDKRPLDLVESPSILGLLHVFLLDRLLVEFVDADRVGVRQPTFSHLLASQFDLSQKHSSDGCHHFTVCPIDHTPPIGGVRPRL